MLRFFNIPAQVFNEDKHIAEYLRMLQRMINRMAVSHFKYGEMADKYPDNAKAIDSVQKRIDLYTKTGNTEHLLDAANFLVIEACLPSHPRAHFVATESYESPGIVYREEE